MAVPSSAEILIVSCTWNSVGAGIITGYDFAFDQQYVTIRGEGVTGPTARGLVGRDYIVNIEYLVQPPFAPDAAPQSLVINTQQSDGTARHYTFASMKPNTYAVKFQRDNAPATWTQQFIHVGNMATDPLTIT